ncbi:MAG: hypothetical protein ACOZIN_08520 [Myxococcota bacterium]
MKAALCIVCGAIGGAAVVAILNRVGFGQSILATTKADLTDPARK